MDAAEVVARLGGVARTDQLARHVTTREVAAAVEAGTLRRLARGRYGLPAAATTHLAAQRLGGTIAGLSAAVEHGWPVLHQPDRPWVSVPANRNVPHHLRRGVRLIWSDQRGTTTSPLATVLDCARRLPLAEALAVADSALRSGTVEVDELRGAGQRLMGRGAGVAARVAREATPLARNPLESAARALSLEVPGLRLVPQVPVVVEGVTIHPDLLDERLGLVVETEGWLYHGLPEQFAHDLWRYTALTVARFTVARFGHDAVTLRPSWVTESLETLARTGEVRRSCRRCA